MCTKLRKLRIPNLEFMFDISTIVKIFQDNQKLESEHKEKTKKKVPKKYYVSRVMKAMQKGCVKVYVKMCITYEKFGQFP